MPGGICALRNYAGLLRPGGNTLDLFECDARQIGVHARADRLVLPVFLIEILDQSRIALLLPVAAPARTIAGAFLSPSAMRS